MPMTWNAETDAKLFIAVLATTDVKLNMAAIAQIMGPDCTVKALTHRISAIKKKAESVSPTTPAKATKPPVTPRKRTTPAVKTEINGTSDEGDAEESPKKKAKTNGAGARGKGRKKAQAPASPIAPTTPATPGDLEDGGVKLEPDAEDGED